MRFIAYTLITLIAWLTSQDLLSRYADSLSPENDNKRRGATNAQLKRIEWMQYVNPLFWLLMLWKLLICFFMKLGFVFYVMCPITWLTIVALMVAKLTGLCEKKQSHNDEDLGDGNGAQYLRYEAVEKLKLRAPERTLKGILKGTHSKSK